MTELPDEKKEQPSITCPKCGRTSYHPKDIEEGYCGYCSDWTTDKPWPPRRKL